MLTADIRRRCTDGARVLVVEDNEDFRSLLEFILRDAGYVVDSAASSEQAAAMLEVQRYEFVLSDYSLPGQSGVWLVSQAAARNRPHGIPALIVTGDPDAPGIPDHLAVMPKPVDFDQLLSRVRAMVASTRSDRGDERFSLDCCDGPTPVTRATWSADAREHAGSF